MAEIRVFRELCKGVEDCGICVYICSKKLFKPSQDLNPKGYRPPEMIEKEACTGCENCMIFCPDLAISVQKKNAKRAKR